MTDDPPAGARPGKFQRDVLWNVVSLGLLGVSGILLNVVVFQYHDEATLGVFNQVYAAFIVFSQFAVAGVHYSVLKHLAEDPEDVARGSAVIRAGLLVAILFALVFTALFVASAPAVGALLESPGVAEGMLWAAPGLLCFALNKVLLHVFNAHRQMRLYAALQGLRPLLLVGTLMLACVLDAPAASLPVVFSVSEIVVMLASLGFVARHLAPPPAPVAPWIPVHLRFGLRSFGSGLLSELNTRVDVLMLGYFGSDAVVGIYSFAAILAEGFFQFLVVLRTNYNPILVKLIAVRDFDGLRQTVSKGKRVTYALATAIAAVAVAGYPLGSHVVRDPEVFMAGWPLFAILMAGITLSAGFVPFGAILLQAGWPGLHTAMIGAVVTFNIVANAVLIPPLGATGAAIATGLSFVVLVPLLRAFTRQAIGLRL